jgi:hypothetical protein
MRDRWKERQDITLLRKCLGGLVIGLLAGGCMDQSGLAPGVTRSGIRSVRVEMTETEVEEILGAPAARGDPRPIICGPTSERLRRYELIKDPNPGCWREGPLSSVTLIYFARPKLPGPYPMLWVYLRDGRVTGVHANKHNLVGSHGVYWTTRDGGHVEMPEFEATFPR